MINKKSYVDLTQSVVSEPIFSSKDNSINSGSFLHCSLFHEQLRFEILRAQRSNSPLSLVLLTSNTVSYGKNNKLGDILALIGINTRDTDIKGFINHKTIGVILPYTDEKGAKKISEKLGSYSVESQISVNYSTFPDEIFESLKNERGVQPNALFFQDVDPIRASWFKFLIKRSMDIVGSFFFIFLFTPIMLIAVFSVKLTSPGPVIFTQIRLGKNGIPFKFYKFRSMYVNMNDQIHREYVHSFIDGHQEKINQGTVTSPFYKIKFDPRITKVGKFLRRSSIDELPQLFNVLKGDMSLVGPRPPVPYEAERYQTWHLRRILEMKPGITGLWQVEGRSKTGWDDSVRLDIQYLQKWSLLLDIKILLKTVKEVLLCRGAV